MKFNPAKAIHVYYKPMDEKIPVGRLALSHGKPFFEYDPSFLATGLNLSPFKLPPKAGAVSENDGTFDGLFGVFNDSLPDGWAMLLLDCALIKHHIDPAGLSVLDRLSFVGTSGMGALIYEPESGGTSNMSHESLDTISKTIAEFQQNDDHTYVEDLLVLSGSWAGTRPKVLIPVEDQQWLIKFPSHRDPKDMGAIEYAYHLMAQHAGLDLPRAQLFPGRKGPGFFGSQRFDTTDNTRIHMHTISGLLHADHRSSSLDYATIMKATMHLTKDMNACKQQYKRCVFNVLSHNRDDHAKNFSFLMDSKGVWRISPAYDVTFSSGPGGEHCSMVVGEIKNPGIKQLLSLAELSSISTSDAMTIIDQVKSSVSQWSDFAREAGVSKVSRQWINSAIGRVIRKQL